MTTKMVASLSSTLAILLTLTFSIQRSNAVMTYSIDSAFTCEKVNAIILYSGNIVIYFHNSERRYLYAETSRLLTKGFPRKANTTACVDELDDHNNRLYYFSDFGYLLSNDYVNKNFTSQEFNYGQEREFIRTGGPDAAVRKDGKHYFFKGCQMAERIKWDNWSKPTDVRDLNLPCDVDAAWKQGDDAVILKGDQVWVWKDDDVIEGPRQFCEIYNCKGEIALNPAQHP